MNSVRMTIYYWLGPYLVTNYRGEIVVVGGLNGGERWEDHDKG
jgi:hypothetical protein